MAKLSFHDRLARAILNKEELPLEGRTRITLTDVHTGKREVFEDKNTVTNALSNIINSNYGGTADIARLMPLKQFFSGVLCFNQTIQGTPIAPPCETVNSMIANAGDEAHSSASTTRGNPNGGEYVETDTSVKFVWDWQTNQGNGTINSVCLVPALLGNCGLKPIELFDYFMLCADNGTAKFPYSSWNRNEALHCPIEIVDDETCLCLYVNKVGQYSDGTTFEEITVKHDFTSFGILRGARDYVEDSSRTATIRSRSNRWGVCFDENYYYVYSVTDATHLQVDKIDRDTFTVSTADLTLSGVSLYTGWAFHAYVNAVTPQFPFDGTYLYLPDSLATGMIRINLSDASDCTRLTGTLANSTISTSAGVSHAACGDAIVIGSKLAYGDRYLINGDNLYEMEKAQAGDWLPNGQYAGGYAQNVFNCYAQNGHNPSYFVAGTSTEGATGCGLSVNRLALFTVNNLQASVVKSTSQAMKIEYTLTQV